MSDKHVFVSESVTKGHPDKLCDQISDALVDDFLRVDGRARIDAECAVSNGIVFIGAHYRADNPIDVAETARRVIRGAGYSEGSFNHRDCAILTSLNEITTLPLGPVAASEVDDELIEQHVSQHQATVFGYACKQTPEFMPLPIRLAHELVRRLDEARQSGELGYLMPDGKSQVAVEYRERAPHRIHSIALNTSADPSRAGKYPAFVSDIIETVIEPAMSDETPGLDDKTRLLVNHDGEIGPGGPSVHSGLTGRKTAVDTYGEYARHSGAALSGKDALHVDRLGAYAARHAAKNVVAAGLADECEVQISYTIGIARPVGFHVETFGTGKMAAGEIAERIHKVFEFRPLGMMLEYARNDCEFRDLAVYGHVGRVDVDLPWEKLDKVDALA